MLDVPKIKEIPGLGSVLLLLFVTACVENDQPFPATDAALPSDPVPQVESRVEGSAPPQQPTVDEPEPTVEPEPDLYEAERQRMVDRQLARRDIVNPRVLDVFREMPRHLFVPENLQYLAYRDSPLPIGHDQTISQPYIVALMTQLVNPKAEHKALDIGTGSGYQAAILAKLAGKVYSIEIVEPLAIEAGARLKEMGYDNVEVRHGDGYRGWKTEAPFDVIVVAAAPDHIPQALVDQLAVGGKMVIPVGRLYQNLIIIEKLANGKIKKKKVAPVRFVPMTGEAEK